MSLPTAVRVRRGSETEGAAISPAVSELMPMNDLAARVLALTGKEADRVREIFAKGSLVLGASRLRWEPVELDSSECARLLGRFPDPDPERAFDAGLCTAVVVIGRSTSVTVDRQRGQKRRMFRRDSFWDRMMELARATAEYKTYSYHECADVYRAELGPAGVMVVHEAAGLLAFPAYQNEIRRSSVNAVEFHVPRPGS